MPEPSVNHNVVWFDIPAVDLDRAIKFYSAVLGAPVVKEVVGEVALGWLPTQEGGRMGCVCTVPGFTPSPNGVMIYLGVAGRLRSAVAAVGANGGDRTV
jgi:uncharacterized protein